MRKTAVIYIAFLLYATLALGETAEVGVDTLRLENTVMQGRISGLDNKGVTFSPNFGKGSVTIPFGKIVSLQTEHEYHLFYNGREIVGKIVGISGRNLLFESGGRQESVAFDDIEQFLPSVNDDGSFANRVHNLFPFWSGNIDIGLEFEQGATDENKLDLAMRFEYDRLRNRFVFIGIREFDMKKTPDTNWTTSKDEYLFNIEDDYYLSREREAFAFATCGFERDAIREIERRIYPAAGVGHTWTMQSDLWVNLQLGLGGVFDDYTTYGEENYLALYMGSEALYEFDSGSQLRGKVLYMPSVLHDRNAWLFRIGLVLTIPLTELFAFKMSIEDVDDNNPSPDIGNNQITTNFALSFTI